MADPSPYTLEILRAALRLPDFDWASAQRRLMPLPRRTRRDPNQPGRPRQSAVLALLYQRESALQVVLTKRRDDLDSHAGQISFPGGSNEPPETFADTALRETQEEIGVRPGAVELLGQLSTLYIPPSDFEVHPFVAWHALPPRFRPAPAEVAEVITVTVDFLLDRRNQRLETWTIRGNVIDVPFFQVGEHKVWGATAMMLAELLTRLQVAAGQTPSLLAS